MNIGLLRNLAFVASLLLTVGCTTSGIVASDVDLSLGQVKVIQTGQVDEGAKFSHQLQEEIRHEFSRLAPPLNKRRTVSLNLNILKLEHSGERTSGFTRYTSVMAGNGSLTDLKTGTKSDDFQLKVFHHDDKDSTADYSGQRNGHSYLITRMARAMLEKVYGTARAKKMIENPASYVQVPYGARNSMLTSRLLDNPRERQTKGLRLSIASGMLPPNFIGPPTQAAVGKQAPKVIEAPLLPIQ